MSTEPLLVTVPEAAKMLQVSVATVWNLFSSGELAFVKIRGSRRVHVDELRRIAANGTQQIKRS